MPDLTQNEQLHGSFLIVPLKYDSESLNQTYLEEIGTYRPITTMDLNENIKKMLDKSNDAAVGLCFDISPDHILPFVSGADDSHLPQSFLVSDDGNTYTFELSSSYIYVFHTQVAFLCLSISYEEMEALKAVCNPGSAYNPASFYWVDEEGQNHLFSIETWLDDFLAPLGLKKFFDGDSSYLLDSYAYIFTVVPNRFDTIEEMQKITFNLHKMMPIDSDIYDTSEDDIRYVYAVKHQAYNTYRWGCCVASQTISYVFADEAMDFEAQREAQANDGLPVVILSLYEKYTCLRFTELITAVKKKQIRNLKNMMLRFQAFGTVTPANLSRWHNVKQIYAHLLQVNDISSAIEDISSKINILTEHQEEIERTKSETVVNIITVFGLISIMASVLSIVQILSGGNIIIWISTILTAFMMVLVTFIALWKRKKW